MYNMLLVEAIIDHCFGEFSVNEPVDLLHVDGAVVTMDAPRSIFPLGADDAALVKQEYIEL